MEKNIEKFKNKELTPEQAQEVKGGLGDSFVASLEEDGGTGPGDKFFPFCCQTKAGPITIMAISLDAATAACRKKEGVSVVAGNC